MSRQFRFRMIVILATSALATYPASLSAQPTAALPGPNIPDGLGVNIHFTDPRPGEMEMLAAGGFRWVRMDFGWGSTEREKGVYDFAAYDRLMTALEKHHVRAVFILDYANRYYDHGLSPCSDEGRRAMARWAAAAVRHFRARGILWEMYNEPNIQFWKPKPNVDDYVKTALVVGKAIRDAEPDELYCGPATSTIPLPWLETCFKSGLLDYWSAVTVHPYRQGGPEKAIDDYAKLRTLIDRYAPKGKKIPIISGEWGYSSAWGKYDEQRQGKMLPREWLVNLSQGVPLSIWYDWHDDGQDAHESEHHFGTVHFEYRAAKSPVYDPKPAYLAARTLTSVLAGYDFDSRMPGYAKDDYLFAFRKGKETRYAVWTTAKEHEILMPVAGCQIVSHIGQNSVSMPDGLHAVKLTLTDSPQYLLVVEK